MSGSAAISAVVVISNSGWTNGSSASTPPSLYARSRALDDLARRVCRPPGDKLSSNAVTDLPDDFQTAPLAEVDPEIAQVLDRELGRQQDTLEMIASENFVPQAVLEAAGSVLTNKYAEGYPGRRYYGGCEEVDVAEQLAIDRALELFGARPRQRPAPRRRPGQQRRLHGDAGARRHDHGHGARPRRAPQPRHEAERLGQAVCGRPLPRPPRGPALRHGRGREPGEGAQAEGDRRRLVGLSAPARLPRLPRDRRLGRRPADGGHGPLRRPRRRGRAPEPGRARRRRHDHGPQDPLRPAQRYHPLPRGAGQGHRPLGLPGPAGRPADAHHRRQGGGARDRAERAVQGAPASDDRQRPRPGRGPGRRAAWTCSPAAPTCTWC